MNRVVTLNSNGAYWLAYWRDDFGKPIRRSIGAKSKLTRRQALERCAEIAKAESTPTGPMTLQAFTERYLELRGDLGEKTIQRHRLAVRYMIERMGAETRVDRLTPAAANDFVAWLRERDSFRGTGKLSDFSVHSMATLAREIMAWAVRDGRIGRNPFDGIKIKQPKIQKKKPYITAERVELVMESCPDAGWRAMFALCRMAGLRASEAMYLRFDEIDRQRAVLTVWPREGEQTTKQAIREVPIAPRLMAVIDEAQEAAQDGEEYVAWGVKAESNYNHRAREIMRKANEDWPEPFKSCRASLETDWQAKYPALAVAAWMGHDIRVSLKHYIQDDHLASMVTGRDGIAKSMQKVTATSGNGKQQLGLRADVTIEELLAVARVRAAFVHVDDATGRG